MEPATRSSSCDQNQDWSDVLTDKQLNLWLIVFFFFSHTWTCDFLLSFSKLKQRPCGSFCHILNCSRLICWDFKTKKTPVNNPAAFKGCATISHRLARWFRRRQWARSLRTRPLPLRPSSARPERRNRISLGEVLYCCNSPHWFCSPLTAAAVNRLEFNERESRWNMTAGSPENIHNTRRMNRARVLMSGYDEIPYRRTELLRQFIKSLWPKTRRPAPSALTLHFASE